MEDEENECINDKNKQLFTNRCVLGRVKQAFPCDGLVQTEECSETRINIGLLNKLTFGFSRHRHKIKKINSSSAVKRKFVGFTKDILIALIVQSLSLLIMMGLQGVTEHIKQIWVNEVSYSEDYMHSYHNDIGVL